MSKRFPVIALSAVLAMATLPALAQEDKSAPPPPVQAPSDLPKPQHGDPQVNLDRLFAALKVAPDDESAKYIENRIWSLWTATESDTASLLMSRVKIAVDHKDLDLGIKLLSAIIEMKPDYLEAWNRRATLYYTKKDFGHAIEDIHEVLRREPRHFGAWSGLGMILQEIGDDKEALAAYRHALAVHPHLDKIPELVKQLSEKVEGRDI